MSAPPPQPYSSSPMSSPHLPTRSRYINSPESRIAIARARATMQRKPPVSRPLADIAMPDIRPTAYSARWPEEVERHQQQIPSSPPDSHGADLRLNLRQARVSTPSPTVGKKRVPHTPMQLSSPPGSPRRGLLNTAARKVHGREKKAGGYGNGNGDGPDGLTSSVVKGQAANSLLQLNRAIGAEQEFLQE